MDILIPAWRDGRLEPVEKLEVHRRGLRHKAVSVFVMAGTQTLLQRRAEGKYHTPGLWTNSCCTHPEWEESPATCATRRLFEELGIEGVDPVHRGQIEYRADVGSGMVEHEVVDLFSVEASRDLRVAPNPEEVSETAWMPLHDLVRTVNDRPDRFTPWLRIYLNQHAESLFGVEADPDTRQLRHK